MSDKNIISSVKDQQSLDDYIKKLIEIEEVRENN